MSDIVSQLRKDVFYGDERMQRMAQHNPLHMEAAARIAALERALDEIIMEATSLNHAIDIARRARAEGGE